MGPDLRSSPTSRNYRTIRTFAEIVARTIGRAGHLNSSDAASLHRSSRLTPAKAPAESAHGLRRKLEKLRAAGVVAENLPALISSARDVVRQPRLVKSQWSRHEHPRNCVNEARNLLGMGGKRWRIYWRNCSWTGATCEDLSRAKNCECTIQQQFLHTSLLGYDTSGAFEMLCATSGTFCRQYWNRSQSTVTEAPHAVALPSRGSSHGVSSAESVWSSLVGIVDGPRHGASLQTRSRSPIGAVR